MKNNDSIEPQQEAPHVTKINKRSFAVILRYVSIIAMGSVISFLVFYLLRKLGY